MTILLVFINLHVTKIQHMLLEGFKLRPEYKCYIPECTLGLLDLGLPPAVAAVVNIVPGEPGLPDPEPL